MKLLSHLTVATPARVELDQGCVFLVVDQQLEVVGLQYHERIGFFVERRLIGILDAIVAANAADVTENKRNADQLVEKEHFSSVVCSFDRPRVDRSGGLAPDSNSTRRSCCRKREWSMRRDVNVFGAVEGDAHRDEQHKQHEGRASDKIGRLSALQSLLLLSLKCSRCKFVAISAVM